MSKHIKVIVTGSAGSGKSTIIDIIAEALRNDHGIDNIEVLDEDYTGPMGKSELYSRVDSLVRDDLVVSIEQHHARRPAPNAAADYVAFCGKE